jgi:hypothetical protein
MMINNFNNSIILFYILIFTLYRTCILTNLNLTLNKIYHKHNFGKSIEIFFPLIDKITKSFELFQICNCMCKTMLIILDPRINGKSHRRYLPRFQRPKITFFNFELLTQNVASKIKQLKGSW